MTDPQPPTAAEIEARILRFLQQDLLGPDVEADGDSDLLSGELLDSVQVLRLAGWAEETFQVRMEPADFVVENFRTAAVLASFVHGRLVEADHPAEPE